MLTINTKSTVSEILSWKKSKNVKDALQKLNQNIVGHEDLTWCTKNLGKIGEYVKRKNRLHNCDNTIFAEPKSRKHKN